MQWVVSHAVSICVAVVSSAPAWSAVSSSVNPTADAFVATGPSGELSGNNYGAGGSLALSASGSSQGEFQSVLKFNLASVKSSFDAAYGAGHWSIQSASLQLTKSNPNNTIFSSQSSGSFAIRLMQSNAWLEGTGTPNTPTTDGITYASLPAYSSGSDPLLGTYSYSSATSGTFIYDLALGTTLQSDITSGGTASLRLLAADTSVSMVFNSRTFGTSTARPLLSVTAVPEPTSVPPIALCCGALLFLRRRHRVTFV